MIDIFFRVFVTFRLMPLGLRLITLFCCAGIFFVVGPFVPLGGFTIDGQRVTQGQFWASGAAPSMILTGILMVGVATLLLKRRPLARLTLIALTPVTTFVQTLLSRDWSEFGGTLASSAIICVLLAIYVYRRKTVRAYFTTS